MTTSILNENGSFVKTVPIVRQLHAIFDSIPDDDLLTALKAPTGRPEYTVEVLS